ncbi:hypothetical protein [Rubinisphaera italica]|uniref:Uncharacterized protein n=1 Tax=Rubinisphaera italica TaxID=2527969 RepID=A0A5C5X9V8_9PLAN|nr:hypothetical protein [Rubinisphaera italica]TWT59796.1 hypothetical protein Pan54_05060 [Rubinisphaera italica]
MNTFNKAAEIRKILEDEGIDQSSKQIIDKVRNKGIEVTPQQVSNEKRKMRLNMPVDDLPISVIKKVQVLVRELGSIVIVRRALDELEELMENSE